MTESRKKIAELDRFCPPCGPCALCGHRDKRHRLWNMFIDSPDSAERLARDFDVTVDEVLAVREIRPYRRARRTT